MKRLSVALGALLLITAAGIPALVAAQTPEPPPIESAAPPTSDKPADAGEVFADDGAQRARRWGRPVFRLGQHYTLPKGDEVSEVAVVSGDATIEGRIYRDLIVALGSVRLSSTAIVEGDLVVVGGNVVIAPGAEVGNDLVVVGGSVSAAPGFSPGGEHVVVGPTALGGRLEAIVPWVTRGLLWGRPIVPDVQWVWGVVGFFFLMYLTLGVVFDRPVRACADTLAAKPLTAFLVGLLVLFLAGPVFLLLTVSIVGIVVVPFLICALLLAWILGKVGVARWIGMSVAAETRDDAGASFRTHAVRSFTIGFLVLCVAYMIPVLGLVAWASVGVFGLGSAVATFIAGYRKENPVPPRRVVVPVEAPPVAYSPAPPPIAPPQASYQPPAPEPNHVPVMPGAAAHTYASVSDSLAFPHAPFRDRLVAFILDVMLVVIAVQLLGIGGNDFGGSDEEQRTFLLLLAYHIGFWTWKGTTVGGIICQLRVIRVNGEPLRFIDALVRGLSSIFSLAVLGIGGLWILKDPERQAWHDKIAGTYVVKVPRHYPL